MLSDNYRIPSINYLAVSGNKLAIIANFKSTPLTYERVVLEQKRKSQI